MISIIVPIHNVEGYLQASLDSILDSTYDELEVILVDDGSTDGSAEVCDQYALRDSRVRVIHQANAGVSAARNVGLSAAKGDFIGFVDGDDIVHPEMFQVLHDAITSGGYDISMIEGKIVADKEYESYVADKNIHRAARSRELSSEDMIKGMFCSSAEDYQYVVVWNKLYRRELVQDVKFRETSIEDMDWNIRVFKKVSKAMLVEAKMYYWVQRTESITHQRMNKKKIDRINSLVMILEEIPVAMNSCRRWCLEKLYKVILHTRYHAQDTEYRDEVNRLCQSTYKATINEYLSSDIPFSKKYGLLFFYHAPWLYRHFMKAADSLSR